MTDDRTNAVELGSWLAKERGKRSLRGKPLSGPALARFFNTYIQAQKLPVKKVAQQEISRLETCTIDNAPKRQQPWWGALRDFIQSGALDELIAGAESPAAVASDNVVVSYEVFFKRQESVVRTPDGEVVGRIVWTKKQ
jgi:hypothetical protein